MKLFDELVQALSEDFSVAELSDLENMEATLATLLDATPEEARALSTAAAQIRRVRGEVQPFWKHLFNIH